jgi:hypothetical protein
MRMPPVRLFRRGLASRRQPRDPAPAGSATGATPGAAGSATGATPGAETPAAAPTTTATTATNPGETARPHLDTSAPEPGQDGDRHTAAPRTIRPCVPGGAAGAEYALPVPAG